MVSTCSSEPLRFCRKDNNKDRIERKGVTCESHPGLSPCYLQGGGHVSATNENPLCGFRWQRLMLEFRERGCSIGCLSVVLQHLFLVKSPSLSGFTPHWNTLLTLKKSTWQFYEMTLSVFLFSVLKVKVLKLIFMPATDPFKLVIFPLVSSEWWYHINIIIHPPYYACYHNRNVIQKGICFAITDVVRPVQCNQQLRKKNKNTSIQ